MALAKCTFCGKEQEDYRGTYYIRNDGGVFYFSSSKCMKNHLKLKRDKRKIRWTEAFHVVRDKRLAKAKEVAEKVAGKKAEEMSKMKVRAVEKAAKIVEEKSKKATQKK